MEKINLNFDKCSKLQMTQFEVKCDDVVSLFPHQDCIITIEFKPIPIKTE